MLGFVVLGLAFVAAGTVFLGVREYYHFQDLKRAVEEVEEQTQMHLHQYHPSKKEKS